MVQGKLGECIFSNEKLKSFQDQNPRSATDIIP